MAKVFECERDGAVIRGEDDDELRAPMSPPFAHVGALPLEETLGSLGPALLIALGGVAARLRARNLRMRSPAAARQSRGRRARAAP